MSDGKSHSSASIGLSIGILAGLARMYPGEIVSASVGALAGIVLSPDMDVDNGFIGNWYIRWLFGSLPEKIWRIWIRPYAVTLKHRSYISHFPIFSTLFRLIYLMFPVTILLFSRGKSIVGSLMAQLISIPLLIALFLLYGSIGSYYFVFFVAGLCLSDILHFLFDMVL